MPHDSGGGVDFDDDWRRGGQAVVFFLVLIVRLVGGMGVGRWWSRCSIQILASCRASGPSTVGFQEDFGMGRVGEI